MSNAVAKVSFLQGQAWAKAPDGTLRALTVGSTLNDDEILVTAQGARVELDVGNGEPLVVNGGMEVGMSRDFLADTATGADEALLSDASVQEALTVLEEGGDLLEELEETAAGNTGGGGASEGHDFVQLTRIIESTDPQAFDYSSASQSGSAPVENDADYINRAPLVTDQVIASNEDEPVTGQIIADDIEDDTLTFTIATPPANGALVLDPVTGQFTFTPNANYNGADSFVVTVTDSRGNSTNTNITLNIAPVNDAPTTNDINLTTDEDVPVNGQVVAQDIENDTLSYVVSGQPASGTVILDPVTGAFVYSPNANFNGSDSFVVTISDGNGGTTTSIVTIGVNPVNDIPVSNDQNLVTDEDVPVSGQIVASDIDGDTLGYTVSGQPTNGSVVLNPVTGGFVYTPNANYNGGDSFVVTISDGNGGTTTSTITIGVTPVNDAPVSANQNLTTPEDTPLSGLVAATDVDGDTLGYTVSGSPTNGSVTLNPVTGSFVYTPNANYNGSDSFVVTISDGNGGTTTSTVIIGVTPVNDAPVSGNQNLTTPEDTPINGVVSASDVDGDSLSFTVSGNPANGSVVLNAATGSFTYSPNANYNGSDSFVVTISDGNGGTTTSTVNIGVTPVDDTTVISITSPSVTEGADLVYDVTLSGPAANGTSLAYNLGGGSAALADYGTATFSNGVTLVGGNLIIPTGVSSFTVTVPTVDDAITETTEALPLSVGGVTGTGSILDNDPAPKIISIGVIHATEGADLVCVVTLDQVLAAPYSLTYNIGGGSASLADYGTPVFSNGVTIVGGNLLIPAGVKTFSINLPTIDDSIDEPTETVPFTFGGLTLSGNIYDNDAAPSVSIDSVSVNEADGTATFTVTLSAASGQAISVNYASSNGSATASSDYTAVSGTLSFAAGETSKTITVNIADDALFETSEDFTITLSNPTNATLGTAVGTGTIVDNDAAPNNAPVAVDDAFTVAEGGTLTVTAANKITLNDTDADGDSLTAILVSGPNNGSLTLNADGTFTYVHNGSETTTDSFTYKVNDGTVDGSVATVTINVTPENDPPVAIDDVFVIDEDTPLVISPSQLLSNDTDAENNTLTLVTIQSATNGTLSVVGGNIVFTPTLDYSGPASFRYTISDGKGGFSTATVNITVNSVNDPTVMTPENVSVPEDDFINGNVLTNDKDADDLLSIQSYEINSVTYLPGATTNISGVGSFLLLSNGDYEFTPDANYHGSVPVISYTTNTGATSTLTITVTPRNDAPVAADDNFSVVQNGALTISPSQLLANDVDIDGDTLSVSTIFSMTNGSVGIFGGNIIFTPTPGYTGPASFSYSVSDGKGGFDTAVVNIAVTPLAAVPPATDNVTVSGNEDTLITINLSGSDSDGTLAGYVIKSLPANGLLYTDAAMTTLANIGDLVADPVYFKPNADWNGNTSFNYAAQDNDGLQDATPATATITVNPAADTAVLGSGAGTVKEDTPAQSSAAGTLTIVDPDAGEAGFQAQSNAPGTYGSFSIDAAGVWVYNIDNSKPAVQQLKEGESKTDTFTVTSIDGTTTTVAITVKGTNDAPTATADTASVLQDNPLTLTPAQLLINDTDPDQDSLSIDSVQGAVNGSVSLVAGNVVFTPTAGYHGPASFTYTVGDGKGGTSTATVSVTVDKANTAPVANDDAALPSGGGQVGLVSEYYGYIEGTHGGNLASIQQAYSFINGRTADATFIAKTFDYGASRSFSNGLGIGTNLQTFLGSDATSLSADPGNSTDAIIRMKGFVELGAGTYKFQVTGDDGYQIRIDGVVVAEYNQNNGLHVTTHSQFTISSPGVHSVEIVYWDQGGYSTLKLELSDDGGATYDILSSVPLHQTAALSVLEDQDVSIPASSLLGNDTDADGDTLSISSVQGAVHGSVALVGGNVVFTPSANYSGPASFTYTISDGKGGSATATVNLVVTPVNDAPVAVGDTLTLAPNTTVNIPITTLLANDTDVEGDKLTIVSVQTPVNGSVSISGGNVVFTPISNYEGPASFTYTVRDPAGATSTATVNVNVGAATAPSLVVLKSLLAVAHGTGGISVKFPIVTALVDTDGSETLTVRISNVPTSASFNAGTNLGGGVWLLQESDLPNLMLNLPGSFSLSGSNMTVQVISTEANGGATASVSNTVMLHATYTTVDKTTTTSGNLTGTNANEYIVGGDGDNVITGGNGNDVIYGGDGNDILSASSGSDMFYGGAGNDTITGSSGLDRISGGSGNDTMSAGADTFVDVFVWSLGDQGAAGTPAVDTINNFVTTAAGSNHNGGDVLDLRDLLQGEHVGANNAAGNLANYLHFEVSGGNTTIHISHTGGFDADSHTVSAGFTSSAETQKIVLNGVDLQSLYSGATTDQQIITQLLNNNKLITD